MSRDYDVIVVGGGSRASTAPARSATETAIR